jgi:hypothetical protein
MKTLDSSLVFYRAAEDEIEQEVFRNAIIKGYELRVDARNGTSTTLRDFVSQNKDKKSLCNID